MQENKKTKTGKYVFAAIIASLSVALVAGSFFTMMMFIRYVRPVDTREAAISMINDIFVSGQEENTTGEIQSTSDKHFSIEDAALLPDDEEKEALSVIDIVKKVSPATVSIKTEVNYSAYGQTGTMEAAGSGFIISEDGYIVTNSHVIEGAETIQILIPGEDDYINAVLIGSDASTDMAVLQVEKTGLPYVTLGDSDKLEVGELAVAIGNPFGELAGTVTAGVISALDRDVTITGSTYQLLQTDASINTGNSGGPLVNSYGEVIGITNAKVSSGEGIGFAIPVNDIKTVIEDLVNNGYVKGRPVIGVSVVTVDAETADTYGWPTGAYIREVVRDGAAEVGGLQVGDIIVMIDGDIINTAENVAEIRNTHSVGDEIIVSIYRNGETIEKTITLQEATS